MAEIKDSPPRSPKGSRPTVETAEGRREGHGGEGFDQVIERLRGVVEKLEAGSLGLEDSLAAFEEGVRLSRRGADILDRAEERVELLTRGEDGDTVATFPPAPEKGELGQGNGP